VGPGEACDLGLVDRVVPADQVVPAAVEWCRQLTELPPHALRGTRRVVRRDLVEIVDRSRSNDIEDLAREWFRPEVQGPLHKLAEQLTSR